MSTQAGQLSLLQLDEPSKSESIGAKEAPARHNATRHDNETDSERRHDEGPVAASSGDSGPLLTTAETAELLHVHPRTVQRLVRSGTLPAVRLGRAIRFDSRDVRELTNRLKGCAPHSEGRA